MPGAEVLEQRAQRVRRGDVLGHRGLPGRRRSARCGSRPRWRRAACRPLTMRRRARARSPGASRRARRRRCTDGCCRGRRRPESVAQRPRLSLRAKLGPMTGTPASRGLGARYAACSSPTVAAQRRRPVRPMPPKMSYSFGASSASTAPAQAPGDDVDELVGPCPRRQFGSPMMKSNRLPWAAASSTAW